MKRFLLIVLLLPLSIFSQVETQKKLPDPYATKPVSNYSNVIG